MATAASTASSADEDPATVLNATANDTATLLASSDLATVFFRHYNNGVIVAPLVVPNNTALPSAVLSRLKPHNLSFDQLDGFLQRALLWDTGYIYSPSAADFSLASSSARSASSSSSSTRSPFLQVYTRKGIGMASIAPTRNQMESAGCALQVCTTENYGSTWRAVSCQDNNAILAAVQCAIDTADGGAVATSTSDGRPRSVWSAWNSEDRGSTAIEQLNKTELTAPDINVAQYAWSPDENRNGGDADAGTSAPPTVRLLSIHTVPYSDEPPVGQCPQERTDSRGDLLPVLTIPCAPFSAVAGGSSSSRGSLRLRMLSSAADSEWAPPQESKVLASWLKTVAPPKAAAESPTTPTTGVNPNRPASPGTQNNNGGNTNGAPSEQSPKREPNVTARAKSSDGFNMVNLVPILIGALALVAVAVGFVVFRKRSNSKHNGRGMDYGPYTQSSLMKTEDAYFDGAAFLSPPPGLTMGASSASTRSRNNLDNEFHSSNDSAGGHSTTRSTKSQEPVAVRASSDRRRNLPKSALMASLRRGISEPPTGSAGVSRPSLDTEHLKLLQTDPNLSASRVSYDKIVFERIVSKSARYEVWLSQYEGEEIAVKRLVRRPDLADLDEELSLAGASAALQMEESNAVDAFVAEIQITAALEHPNLARFVGVAWSRLPADSLCLVTEYQSNGDLRTYLKSHRSQLTWPRHKMKWAKGVANGLRYLHNQRPVVLHLELNSTHVLLSDRLQPKLIDFGERLTADDWTQLRISGDVPLVSQSPLLQQQQITFPYWAAPEVLRGEGHLMASDVYSFGMMLMELDSCKVPFQDAKNSSNGGKLKPYQKMNMVISGRLVPTVSSSCPDDIRQIVERCTDIVPGRRPKMPEVVRMLELADYELVM